MDMPPPAATQQGRRASPVVERKLDELCACLDDALSSRRRVPGAEARLAAEIKGKTDFLRSLLAAEAECHGGARRPEHLAEAEERFAVLEATFDQWARRAAPASEPEEKKEEDGVGEPEEDEADGTGSTGSTCSCTGSCQEAAAGDAAIEEARKEVPADGVACKGHDAEEARGEAASGADAAQKREAAVGTRVDDDVTPKDAVGKRRNANREAALGTGMRSTVDQRQQRWWRRGATWCGAAGVVALVAVGVAVELAAVAHHNVNVYVVPT